MRSAIGNAWGNKDMPTLPCYNAGDAEKVKEEMHRLGVTLKSVARACGVSYGVISNWFRVPSSFRTNAAVMKWYEVNKDLPTPS